MAYVRKIFQVQGPKEGVPQISTSTKHVDWV